MRPEFHLASIVTLVGAIAGCPAPGTVAEAGRPDAGVASDAGEPTSVRVCTGSPCPGSWRSANGPAALSCLGRNAEPAAGPPVAGRLRVIATDFSGGEAGLQYRSVSRLPIAVFPGAEVRAICDHDCVMGTTDATGHMDATLPAGGWFGYRLPGLGDPMTTWSTMPTLGYFWTFPTTAGEVLEISVIGQQTAGLMVRVLGRELGDATSWILGRAVDCDGRPMANVSVRMFHGGAELCPTRCSHDEVTRPLVEGLIDSSIPQATADGRTRYAGRFTGILPAAEGPVRIEAYGAIEEGAAPQLLACEEVLVEAYTVTLLNLAPLRDDYAPEHGCAGRR